MSNKSNKQGKQKDTVSYMDVLYMTPSRISARDLSDLLKKETNFLVDLWDEMNVLEIELPKGSTVTFEPMELDFEDSGDSAFVKNRGIQTIFALTMTSEDLPVMKPYFDLIVENFKGFFCADTEDFKPVYSGSSAR